MSGAVKTPEEERRSELLAAFAQSLPEPVIVVSRDMLVIAANQPARAILPALRTGDPLVLALRAPEVIDSVRRVAASREQEKVIWRERVPVERIYEVSVRALSTAAAPSGDVVLTLLDLTEAHRVERMRADFVANASHELRTPLSSLLGFIETLEGAARDDASARARFLVIMRQQAQRMARLIDDLLSLSRIEQNAHVPPDASVDLSALVPHVVDALTPLGAESRAAIAIIRADPCVVTGDRDELVRVIENLVENAIKYGGPAETDGPAEIEIEIAAEGRLARFTVRDFGRGIAREHVPRLTERFYRIDVGDSRAKGGTGLGLSIVNHIVARHRGRLTIESAPGQGAAFSVWLPLRDSHN